jgi:hypothetical protein
MTAPAELTDLDLDGTPPEPAGGAGLYDVDPEQRGVSQDSAVAVTGDVAALPDDLEL